ncbi:hypothetical protein [Streptomyces albipurpureus]|uniref:Uncharacterized protein n=1 Tax=Streptomyces albipurpureus TaxID=2897419 RepID=A0ABT0UL96_9ACTN|nr:hypothetical protein [Streptomyces sp. CWNU-1]MCM2389377.1 hypothetical protein [Streptomyces sp. CWNU-1]
MSQPTHRDARVNGDHVTRSTVHTTRISPSERLGGANGTRPEAVATDRDATSAEHPGEA